MFYHPVLLQRRGQFGVIWMEAMQSSPYRVTKRQALQVDIRESCTDILDYVYARHLDQRGKRSRFSLYLSAHLMYGTVSIWRKQVNILLSDVQEVKVRVAGSDLAALESINLKGTSRSGQVTLPDALPKTAEENPFFGTFKHFSDEPWEEFLRFEPTLVSPPPSVSPSVDRRSLLDRHGNLQPELGSPNTVSSRAEITLKELPFSPSFMAEIMIPGEMDIPELNSKELEMMADKDPLDPTAVPQDVPQQDMLPPDTVFSTLREDEQTRPADDFAVPRGDMTPPRTTQGQEARPKGEKKKRRKRQAEKDDLERTRGEHDQPSPEKRASPHDNSLVLAPVEVSPGRMRRRRQLFVDTSIEMVKDDLRHNLSSSHTTCRPLIIPTVKPSTPAEMFRQPGSKHLANPALLRLWKRNCQESLHVPKSLEETPFWTMPDLVRDRDGVLRARRQEASSFEEESSQDETGQVAPMTSVEPPPEFGSNDPMEEAMMQMSAEEMREGSVSRGKSPQHTSLHMPLDQSPLQDDSLGRTRSGRKRSLRGSDEEPNASRGRREEKLVTPIASNVSSVSTHLEVLPEEPEFSTPPPVLDEIPTKDIFSPERRFIRRCELEGGSGNWTTFRDVCPTTFYKRQAALSFATLLTQVSRKALFVRQDRPYSDIFISTRKQNLPPVRAAKR